uniref:Ig-like domain-containing protein n=1 Tax=Leptobrachium leishanense TaxID=445787 RepID=A0A8C5MBB4_9ANUR
MFSLLLLTLLYEHHLKQLSYFVSGQNVIQSPPELTVNEGMEVALSCHADVAVASMAWYIQKPGQTPQYLLQGFTREDDLPDYWKGRLAAKTFPLNITKVKMSDSGTYYCAMRPTLCEEYKEDVQEHHNN